MSNENIYKIYQLADFFINKFNFGNILVKKYVGQNEVWLCNPDKKNTGINLIRISVSSLDDAYRERDRIKNYIEACTINQLDHCDFIDIHILRENCNKQEYFLSACIDSSFYSGPETLSEEFPGVLEVIHDVDNKEMELANRVKSINTSLKARFRRERLKLKNIKIVDVVSLICVLVFVGDMLTGGVVNVYLCNYKPFVKNYHQFWRLISFALVHGSFFHLFLNLYSFRIIGSLYERALSKFQFIFALIFATLVSGLTSCILAPYSATIGLSGTIYCLFVMYIIDAISKGAYRSSTFMMMIGLNLMLNFMPGVAWQTHLGGAIAGLICYKLFDEESKGDKNMYLLSVILVVGLFIRLFMR